MSSSDSNAAAPPPRLHFDDGSRIITENKSSIPAPESAVSTTEASTSTHPRNPRGNTPIETYYEIDRVSLEVLTRLDLLPHNNIDESDAKQKENDGFLCKVALQFPDELLCDSAQVAWLVEESILSHFEQRCSTTSNRIIDDTALLLLPLVFVLGDTTYAPCCPDEIGAMHLSADIIVHYGSKACLSPSECLPVIYSFGVYEDDDGGDGDGDSCYHPKRLDVEHCIRLVNDEIMTQQDDSGASCDKVDFKGKKDNRFLVLFEVRYHQYMKKLQTLLSSQGCVDSVIIGHIPEFDNTGKGEERLSLPFSSCCGGDTTVNSCDNDTSKSQASTCCAKTNADPSEFCKRTTTTEAISTLSSKIDQCTISGEEPQQQKRQNFVIGGLEVPISPSSLSQYTLLYIGNDGSNCEDDDEDSNSSRQFLNIILRCTTSPSNAIKACWSYNPLSSSPTLNTDPSSIMGVSRYLNRRFYLTQKAKLANIIGILVGTLSQARFRSVVHTLRTKIEDSGRACYTFVVGKINVAKLANFAEVECFVLVSCSETSVLDGEREMFHVPVITPGELDIALGEKEWGCQHWSCEFEDFLGDRDVVQDGKEDGTSKSDERRSNDIDLVKLEEDDDGEDIIEDFSDDEPFFSMISGTYVSKKNVSTRQQIKSGDHLTSQPGGGQMTEYKSEAAEFWKHRQFKGLEANIGKDEAKAATIGLTGIASDYGEKS